MPATWLNKYGYGSTASPGQPTVSSQPSWTSKYGTIQPGSTAPLSPAFQNAVKNQNAPVISPAFQNAQKIQSLQGSIVPSEPQSPFQQAGNFLQQGLNIAKSVAKQVIDFLPKAPSYAKAAVQNPGQAAAGAGEATLTAFGSLAGLIEHGIASAANVSIPERWDVSKQTQTLTQLNDQYLKKSGVDDQKAFETGRFLGSFLPYAIASEVSTASVGAKILLPTAEKFLPSAIKFIPAINDAIGFLGIGQIEHDPQNGGRIDQFKNDLIMLSLFETGGLVVKGLTKGTKNLIGTTLNEVKNKPKIDFEIEKPKVDIVKDAIKQDTGNALQTIVANNITSEQQKGISQRIGQQQKEGGIMQSNGTQSSIQGQNQGGKEIFQSKTGETQAIKSTQSGQDQSVLAPKTSGVAKQIEAKAVEKGMVDKGYSELAQYDSSTIKAQSQAASKYTIEDMNKIATGEKPLPKELKAGTPLSIAEDYAIKNNDSELIRKLAKSPLATQISESASELSLSRMRNTESPVKVMSEVIQARAKAVEGKYGNLEKATARVTKDIQSKIKTPNKYDWNSFIESVKC